MSVETRTEQPIDESGDAISDLLLRLIAAAAITAVLLVALPLLIPVAVMRIAGESVATRARFWTPVRGHTAATLAGIGVVVALIAVEVGLLSAWLHGDDANFTEHGDWAGQLWPTFGPWAVANLAAGVLLLPAAWSLHRRRIAGQVRTRRISDVILQTRIEQARKRAADAHAASRIGVTVNPETGKITGIRDDATTAPLELPDGGRGFGVIAHSTVATIADRFRDIRTVRDWTVPTARIMSLPGSASAVRALLVAESGSGKTVLLDSMMLCALDYGWPVFFIDAKGDPADAEHLAALAHSRSRTAAVGGAWDFFAGTADQVTAKLMRLMPAADGANQYYLDEIRGVLQAVQHTGPIRSASDLRERLSKPGQFVRDQYDLQMVNATVDRNGTTAGARALQSLLVALRPLERYLAEDGWSYGRPQADVTIVPLSPVDDAQARLGDLLLLDLRNYLSTRLAARDKSPVLVVVDEFPQLVTGSTDPGDTAGNLFETARSAGVGLILATQSPAGLSNDEIRRRRALTSGAALIFGRSKDPEDVVGYAGTVMQMEASGSAGGEELRSARAQHTFVIPPQDVREAADGAFWIVQAGAIAPFRALPPAPLAPRPADTAPDAEPAEAATEPIEEKESLDD